MNRRILRHALGAALAAIVVIGPASGTIFADAAGPTDYLSEILSVDPPTDSVVLDVIGGDSFVRLRADPAADVVVIGYFGEPYLRFLPGGEVQENRNSPTTYQNEQRYGAEPPDFASADAEPDWVGVANNGTYAWHDHRAHWMQPIRPAGKGPGDRIVEQVIPLEVDGSDVDVTVISTWQPEPSNLPLIAGAVVAVATLTAAWTMSRRRPYWAVSLLPVGMLVALAGFWQYRSLPSETGPRPVWFAFPLIALAAIAVVAVVRRRSPFTAMAGGLVVAIQFLMWGYVKRDDLFAAIVPTGAPQWLDRASVTAALIVGAGALVIAAIRLFPAAPGTPAAAAATRSV